MPLSPNITDAILECEAAADHIGMVARGFREANILDVALWLDDIAEIMHDVVNTAVKFFTGGESAADYRPQDREDKTDHPAHETARSRSLQVAGVQEGCDDLSALLAPYGRQDNFAVRGTRQPMVSPEHGESQV